MENNQILLRNSYFRNISVTTIIILIISAMVLPINIIAIIYTRHAQQVVWQRGLESARHTGDLYIKELDERMRVSENFLIRDTNKNFYSLQLQSQKSGDEFMKYANLYWQELMSRLSGFMEADAYFFYSKKVNYGNAAVNDSNQSSRNNLIDYVDQISNHEINTRSWFLKSIGETKWLIRIFRNKDYYYGSMINVDRVENQITEAMEFNKTIVYFDELSEVQNKGETKIEIASADGFVAHILLDSKELSSQIPAGYQVSIGIAFGYLLLIPFLILIIQKILIRPMHRVNSAMWELEKGNYDFRIMTVGESKETHELNSRFNSMAERLKELKIEVYENKLEIMDIETTNLQLQVNPHFILNSLNIIFSLAKSGKPEDIKSFTKYLAEYLRFSLWNTSGSVCIREEMKCVRNYIEIQRVRFPGKFIYVDNIEEDIEEVKIPALLILNFVENSMKYALNMESEIEIIVIARQEEKDIMISICDTGNGIEENILRKIHEGQRFGDENNKHIGIWNCRRRLNMIYGNEAYCHITSKLREGTQVFIKLPKIEKRKKI